MICHQMCKSWGARAALMSVAVILASVVVFAAGPPLPGADDRCAVCGMSVSGYPNWVAVLVLEDGVRLFFDGPKDMFRYLENPKRYGARKDPDKDDIVEVWVTDYYSTRPIDARSAFFVLGSDVMGPMGPEVVPLASRQETASFRADHGGTRALAFDEMRSEAVPP